MKLSVNGAQMVLDDTGAVGIPLLLIHGFPLDRTLWLAQREGLADIARVVVPDLRGFGESSLPPGLVTMDTYADDLKALLDALEIERAVLSGLSMGGYIALAFYRRYPERVRALILADTRAQPDAPEGRKGRDNHAALAQSQGSGAVGEQVLPKMFAPKTYKTRPQVINSARAMMARQPVEGVVAALRAMRDRPDSTPMLGTIQVPTLVIVGAQDVVAPLKDSQLMRDTIPDAQLAVIPEAGHLSNFEEPEEFNRILREWLKALS